MVTKRVNNSVKLRLLKIKEHKINIKHTIKNIVKLNALR